MTRQVLLLAVAYFAAARLGLLLASVHGSVSPVWPATGLAIWALSAGRARHWSGVALGALAANLSTGPSLMVACAIADFDATLIKPVRKGELHASLTRALAEQRAPTSSAARRVALTSGSASLHVLLAEDNRTNQLVGRRLLEKLGHSVDVANDGAEALALLAENRYDAVLMDCQMPAVDGYMATRQIRAGQVPGLDPRVPIIALTAHAMPSDREKCLAAGMDDYVSKPVNLEQLSAALERCGLRGTLVEQGAPASDLRETS